MKPAARVALLSAIALVASGSAGACHADAPDAPPPSATSPELTREALMDPQSCVPCHADHVREWSGSMHAYAAVDPVFLALNKRMQRETNGAAGDFCVKCHAPVAVQTGLTKDGLNLAQLDPKLLGVTCYFCHNAEFFSGDFHNNPMQLTHDGQMRGGFDKPVANTAHEASYSPSSDHKHDSSAIFCGSCHDIVNPRGTHIERTFAEWRKSHFALEDRLNCGGCHMPERTGLAAQGPGVLVRKIHDHSMPGVDVALTPFPETGPQRAAVQKSLDESLSAALCVTEDAVTGVHVEVTLRNEKVGHSWPSGAGQDRRAWVELEAKRGGSVAFSSGQVPDRTAVSKAADPAILLLRDRHYDENDVETPLFWRTVRVESSLLPVASSSRRPESDYTLVRTYAFPGPMPDDVTMRVKIRPIDFDLVDELVASGDLDPATAERIPTFTLASTVLRWVPGSRCVSTPAP